MIPNLHADLARERAERTEAEQAELYRTPKARLNNALMNVCVGILVGGVVGIGLLFTFLRWGWWGVLGGGLSWIVVSAILMAWAIAHAPEVP